MDGVRYQLHAPVALSSVKDSLYQLNIAVSFVTESVWAFWRRELSLAIRGNRPQIFESISRLIQ